MRETIEHRVAMTVLAADLRSTGQPVWNEIIDVSAGFDDALPFTEARDLIVAALRASTWVKTMDAEASDTDAEVLELIDDLADSTNADEFDDAWSELYYPADFARIWFDTIGRAR